MGEKRGCNGRLASSRFFRDTLSTRVRGGGPVAKRPTSGQNRWRKSAEFRQIARKSARANLKKFSAAPRCGAARKRDGAPCEKPAMKNGRCDRHGGKTPRGSRWHVPQYAGCASEAKLNRKLRDHQRYAKKRAARLAAMTPEQRTKHDAWHRSHAPGAAAARNARRERTRQNGEARRLLSPEPCQRSLDPEKVRIETALADARAKLLLLETQSKPTDEDEGIFA